MSVLLHALKWDTQLGTKWGSQLDTKYKWGNKWGAQLDRVTPNGATNGTPNWIPLA